MQAQPFRVVSDFGAAGDQPKAIAGLSEGVILVEGPRLRHVANGVIQTAGGDLGTRLSQLYRGLCAVIAAHAPDAKRQAK